MVTFSYHVSFRENMQTLYKLKTVEPYLIILKQFYQYAYTKIFAHEYVGLV